MNSKYPCILTNEAELEYLEAVMWYEEKKSGLGRAFMSAVREKIMQISQNPQYYSKRKGRLRLTNLGKPFPYVIIFVFDEASKKIIVNSIFHTSRNPEKFNI